MYLSFNQEIDFIKNNSDYLKSNKNLVLCPSFLSLDTIKNINNEIQIGAQNCSEYQNGPFTGEISAKSLSELNVNYCIIGHSERREMGETDETIVQKVKVLLENKITPIICIGENLKDFESGQTKQAITSQIEPILKIIKNENFIIAYEPIWAIGTGKTPYPSEVYEIADFIRKILEKHYIQHNNYKIVYGGSVSSKNISSLKLIENIDGFLIGKASIDFQELKKIVE